MRVASIPVLDPKAVHLLPLGRVVAREDDDRGGGVDPVAIGAAAKGEIEPVPESYEVCEGVVLAIVEHASDVGNLDFRRRFSADGSQDSKRDESGYQTSFHASRV